MDDARARPRQGRHLEAQGLAAAGGHQDERVAAIDHMVDDLRLPAPERLIAKDVA